MKRMFLALGALFVFGALVWAVDYPYHCTETVTCKDDCTSVTATCLLSATASVPVECANYTEPNIAYCVVKEKTGGAIISQTGSSCSGCGNGGGGSSGCSPGSGARWIGCDPFAY